VSRELVGRADAAGAVDEHHRPTLAGAAAER
jgi:hypothetical protein